MSGGAQSRLRQCSAELPRLIHFRLRGMVETWLGGGKLLAEGTGPGGLALMEAHALVDAQGFQGI